MYAVNEYMCFIFIWCAQSSCGGERFLCASESRAKHAQCFDVALHAASQSVVVASKDYKVYLYKYRS